MSQEQKDRRAALDGLGKILDAGALEELFTGPEEDALFLYDLLLDATRGRASTYYWEICRTARRRGVSPEYVIDRASVLHATMVERRRTDLYRILGVPPLSSNETIRRRWLEIAKLHHPDVGGDGTVFRRARQAYDVLSDATRRGDYERFWLRALGPFERVAPADRELPPPSPVVVTEIAVVTEVTVVAEVPVAPEPPVVPEVGIAPGAPVAAVPPTPAPSSQPQAVSSGLDQLVAALARASRILEAGAALDRRLAPGDDHGAGLAGFLARVNTALARVGRDEIDALRAEALAAIERLEHDQRVLGALISMRAKIEPVRLAS
jgi:curved DNA-binding protein CbpA